MSYSGGIAEWSGGTVLATEQRGWKTSLWTALVDTTDEPSLSSSDWQINSEVQLQVISFQEVHMPSKSPFNPVAVAMISFQEQHTNRPPTTELAMISFVAYRPKPFIQIYMD